MPINLPTENSESTLAPEAMKIIEKGRFPFDEMLVRLCTWADQYTVVAENLDSGNILVDEDKRTFLCLGSPLSRTHAVPIIESYLPITDRFSQCPDFMSHPYVMGIECELDWNPGTKKVEVHLNGPTSIFLPDNTHNFEDRPGFQRDNLGSTLIRWGEPSDQIDWILLAKQIQERFIHTKIFQPYSAEKDGAKREAARLKQALAHVMMDCWGTTADEITRNYDRNNQAREHLERSVHDSPGAFIVTAMEIIKKYQDIHPLAQAVLGFRRRILRIS